MRTSMGTVTLRTWERGTLPCQGQPRSSDSVTRFYVTFCGMLWETTCADRAVRTSARPPTDTVLSSPGRQANMPPSGIQREVIDLLSQDKQHLEVRLLNDTIGGIRRLFQCSLLENDLDWAPMQRKLRELLEKELPLYVPVVCLSSFRRVFVDDADQLETVKSLTGSVGHRLYAAFKANAHRADIFRYVDHYLRGGLYLDIKTALLEPLERIQERIVAEFKADESLIAHAANLCGWDLIALAASGPPDYFMTAIGKRKDHIFQGILLGRPCHPLMLAALLHCFGPTLVDQQDLSGFRYMAFCEELFRVIKADRYQGAGSPPRRQADS
eukprot:s2836_g5.t2